eukprot:10008452-Heterocapsa_arctica.AAC.1
MRGRKTKPWATRRARRLPTARSTPGGRTPLPSGIRDFLNKLPAPLVHRQPLTPPPLWSEAQKGRTRTRKPSTPRPG